MRWNEKYGQFSKAYFDDDYFGYEELLSDPYKLSF